MSAKARQRKEQHAARAAGNPLPETLKIPAPIRKPLPMARQCGACTGCCIQFDLVALEKARGIPCQHLKTAPDGAGMCSIWNAPTADSNTEDIGKRIQNGEVFKPKVCAEYRCLWLKGDVPESLYPGTSGVIFGVSGDLQKIVCYETKEGASRQRIVEDYIATIVNNGVPVIVLPPKVPGQEEKPRRLIRPQAGKNPRFDRDLAATALANPGAFVSGRK